MYLPNQPASYPLLRRLIGSLTAVFVCATAIANEYRDNPPKLVDLKAAPQYTVVGALERIVTKPEGGNALLSGSAVLVSPCYVITNHHVAFGGDLIPITGKDYSMVFRAGLGDDEAGFAGHTDAVPVLWGNIDKQGRNDWALMQLHNCVGQMNAFGWAEVSSYTQSQLVNLEVKVSVVGYSVNSLRGVITASYGVLRDDDSETNMMRFDASLIKGQSGGALFTLEDDNLRLAGIATREVRLVSDKGADTFQSYSDRHPNLAQGAFEILNRQDVRGLLDRDKARFGRPNPAAERLKLALPTLP